MITLEAIKCSRCGLCATICHAHCIRLDANGPIIAAEFCSTCSQCIAVCPTRALAWNHIPPDRYDRHRLPSPEQLDELFKERRSIRHFKQQTIDRALANLMYYTQVKGVGSYVCGNGQLFWIRIKPFETAWDYNVARVFSERCFWGILRSSFQTRLMANDCRFNGMACATLKKFD